MAALQTEFVRVADDAERAAELLKLVRGREGRTLVFANSACRRDGAEMWPGHSRERESSLPVRRAEEVAPLRVSGASSQLRRRDQASRAARVAEQLRASGCSCFAFHPSLSAGEREAALAGFGEDERGVLACSGARHSRETAERQPRDSRGMAEI